MYFLCVLFPIYIYIYIYIYINIYPTFSGDICSVPNFGQLDLAHRCGAFRQVWSQNRGTPLFCGVPCRLPRASWRWAWCRGRDGPGGDGPAPKKGKQLGKQGKHGKTWENTKYNPKFLKKNRRKHAENPRIHLWIIICPIAIGSFSPCSDTPWWKLQNPPCCEWIPFFDTNARSGWIPNSQCFHPNGNGSEFQGPWHMGPHAHGMNQNLPSGYLT